MILNDFDRNSQQFDPKMTIHQLTRDPSTIAGVPRSSCWTYRLKVTVKRV